MRDGYEEVYYADGVTPVRIGDFVGTRIFFRKTQGRVAYVPGLSDVNPEMEFNGLTYVGIRPKDQGMLGVTVIPDQQTIKKSKKFIARGSEDGFEQVKPDEALFEDRDGKPL